MHVQLRHCFLLTCLVLAAACSESEIQLAFDEHAKANFASLPGTLGVSLATRNEKWQYKVSKGTITTAESLPSAPKEATAIMVGSGGARMLSKQAQFEYRGPYLLSPDGGRVSAAIVFANSYIYSPSSFVIADVRNGSVIAELKGESEKLIDSFAWSRDSEMVAVLKHARESRFRPQNILAALAGHPVASNAYYIEVFDTRGNLLASSKFASGLEGSWGEIVWTN